MNGGPPLRELGPWVCTPEPKPLVSRGADRCTWRIAWGPRIWVGGLPQVRRCLHCSSCCAPAVPTGPLLCLSPGEPFSAWENARARVVAGPEVRRFLLPKEGKSWDPLSTDYQSKGTQGRAQGLGSASHRCYFLGSQHCEAEGCRGLAEPLEQPSSWNSCPARGRGGGAADSVCVYGSRAQIQPGILGLCL